MVVGTIVIIDIVAPCRGGVKQATVRGRWFTEGRIALPASLAVRRLFVRRLSLTRLAILLVPPLALLTVVVLVSPLSPRTAGDTRCFPFIGARVTIDSAMTAHDRTLARAHEGAHAAQCDRDGFLRNYFSRLTKRGRLAAEVGAFCAEGRADVASGTRPDHVVQRILDELEEGYPWFRGTTRQQFLSAFEGQCADLVAPARRRAPRPLA